MSTKKNKITKLPDGIKLPPLPKGFNQWELCGWGGLLCAEHDGTVWNSHYKGLYDGAEWFSPISHTGEARGNPSVFYIRAIKHPAPKPAAKVKKTKAMSEVTRLREAIRWALGELGEFAERPEGAGKYWWRSELRNRAFASLIIAPKKGRK